MVTRHAPLAKEIGQGLLGGLVGTLVMDLVLMGMLAAAGMQPLTCFSIVGDTVASMFSNQSAAKASSIPLGIATHYLVGPLMGGLFTAVAAKARFLPVKTLKSAVTSAVVYAEILSQPMLVMAPILLKMSTLDTLQWFGGALVMHLIWGIVLGIIVYHQKPHITA